MINLKVDEAYAFDYLSILEVKESYLGSQVLYGGVARALKHEVGAKKYNDVINSKEYRALYEANDKIFWMLEQLRTSNYSIDARLIDNLNMERFKVKKALQEKFFENKITEVKT